MKKDLLMIDLEAHKAALLAHKIGELIRKHRASIGGTTHSVIMALGAAVGKFVVDNSPDVETVMEISAHLNAVSEVLVLRKFSIDKFDEYDDRTGIH
jgi:hypothetical protein